jgi:type III secretory pathway component EscU
MSSLEKRKKMRETEQANAKKWMEGRRKQQQTKAVDVIRAYG